MIFAGDPAAIQYDGMFWVTTLLAAIILPLPIVTLGIIIEPSPIHTLSSMITGPLLTNFLLLGLYLKYYQQSCHVHYR